MEVVAGLRVVRGPDWKWGEQDGGEGHLGTVAAVEVGGSSVVVQWDRGLRCRYRCGGREGKFDLRVYDTAPTGMKHPKVQCEWCREFVRSGLLWKCVRCLSYYLCMECYTTEKHSTCHEFDRIDSGELNKSTRVTLRHRLRRVPVRGVFPGAKVVRGRDWRWMDQDGGQNNVGKVISVKNWQNMADRCVATVQWAGVEPTNNYRIGLNGKMDLECTPSGSVEGGHYYPDHLPVLGVPYVGRKPTEFSAGDSVKVEVDVDVLKLMQENHGGWNEMMFQFLGTTGRVETVLEKEDLLVRYPNNAVFVLNPEIVVKVEEPYLIIGDIVRVLDDIGEVHRLQQEDGGWMDDMALCLGQIGRVVKRGGPSTVQVSVNGKRWIFNSKCVVPAPEVEIPNNASDEEVDLNSRLQMLSLVSDDSSPEGIPYAAAAGDAATLRTQLDNHPEQIDVKVKGKSGVHLTCTEGYIDCLKLLLDRGADAELMDDGGERALHLCAYSNQVEAAGVLLEHGVDVNSRNVQEHTALTVAAGVGHHKVVKLLADHQQVDLHAQASTGNTALHCAVVARRNNSISVLLESGADPCRVNFNCSTPLHDAAGFGLLPAVERMVAHHPDMINIQKVEDGYTPLHVAVANNQPAVAEFLSQQPTCKLDVKTSKESLTPLHIAVHEGYSAMAENLVGCGMDVNATTSDGGNTPLHLVISRKNMKPISRLTPQLEMVNDKLLSRHSGFAYEPYVVMACFLVQEGGDLYLRNFQGISPIQLAPPNVGNVITSFSRGRGTFHGSLRGHKPVGPTLPRSQLKRSYTTPRHPPPSTEKRTPKPASTAREVAPPPNSTTPSPPLEAILHAPSSTTTPHPIPLPPSLTHIMQPSYPPATPPSVVPRPPLLPSPSLPAQPALNRGITSAPDGKKGQNLDKGMPKAVGRKPKMLEQRNDAGMTFKDMPGLATTYVPVKKEEEPGEELPHDRGTCFMCEFPADAQLRPCGHSGMCLRCAESAKRCPECKAHIESVVTR